MESQQESCGADEHPNGQLGCRSSLSKPRTHVRGLPPRWSGRPAWTPHASAARNRIPHVNAGPRPPSVRQQGSHVSARHLRMRIFHSPAASGPVAATCVGGSDARSKPAARAPFAKCGRQSGLGSM